MSILTGNQVLLPMVQWIPALVMGGCILLLVLVFFLFRKLYRFDREVKAKEQKLKLLDEELTFKEHLQDKAIGIIADLEHTANQLEDLLSFLIAQFKLGFAGLICTECDGGQGIIIQLPVPALLPDKFLEWLRERLSPAAGGTPAPFRLGTDESPGFLDPSGGLPAQPALIFPLFPRGVNSGGLIFCLPAAELDRREKELLRIGKLVEALVAYRMLLGEIAFRTEEANVVSMFLTEIASFAATDQLLDSMFDYLRDNYPQTNITLLLEEADETARVQKGALIEAELVLQLIPKARQELERGRQMLYAPDQVSLMRKYALSHPPREIQAILIVPLVTFNQIFGYITFESRKANPFKGGTLSTLIRLAEIGSFVLRTLLHFQAEIAKKSAEIERQRQSLAAAQRSLEENELVLREVTNYNAIFSLTQAVRMNVTSLRGFLQLGEEHIKAATPAAYDPVFFRNCSGELEKIERGVQKLELSRIITDREFTFRAGEVDAVEFFSRAFQGVRTKAVLKKIEVESRFDERLQHLMIDPEMTALVLQQFLERLLDFVSDGRMQALGVARETEVELLVKFQPGANNGRLAASSRLPDLHRDFHYILMNRTISRQGGQMDLEVNAERGFLFRLLFVGKSAV